ncbi:MAG: glycosyltransferase family 2 protein [Candidatus Latescibacteria bacterium]|jgi:glycosyltransferase involved in cell wall biosynthesis|nr:glycosyltransferase family 2 protein [Candidatus Latescibacterota bacterium]MBT4137202.1 glycosyltransferase family 2 protein [Candidatus Latescibacterota bacterium]
MSEKHPSLTCFFPCYNDAHSIGSLVAAADTVAAEYTSDYEIIVIDDGSTDSSRELLTELQNKYPNLKLILHEQNKGYGGALQSGFRGATKDLIFYTDGDGQYDVFELRKLLRVMQEGVDVVNGYKIERSDPLHRIIIGKVYLNLMRFLFFFKVRDVDCDFRLMRREIFDQISLHHTSGVICIELVKKMELSGYHFVDFPVHHFHRTHGKSQFFNFRRLFRTGVNILRLWAEIIAIPRLSKLFSSKRKQAVLDS